MKRIYKYTLSHGYDNAIYLDANVKPAHIDMQGGMVTMWMEHTDITSGYTNRTFRIIGTGWDISDSCEYVGTVQDRDTGFVWHVYEVK